MVAAYGSENTFQKEMLKMQKIIVLQMQQRHIHLNEFLIWPAIFVMYQEKYSEKNTNNQI